MSRESLRKGLYLLMRDLEDTEAGLALRVSALAASSGRAVREIEPLAEETIEEVIDALKAATSNTASAFHWRERAEFTIIPLNAYGPLERYLGAAEFTGQGDNPVTFKVGRPSREVAAYILCHIAHNPEIVKQPRWRNMRVRARGVLYSDYGNSDTDRDDTVLGVAAEILGLAALRVSSSKPRSDYETLANSFLFHVAYNTDMVARIGLDPFLEVRRIQRVRRSARGALDTPRQTYTSDVVHHYMMGVAAEIPLLEYLSYYHVAEHYFEKVFNDDLVEQVRRGITDPSFSVRRARDVQAIIRIVTKAQRQVKEEGGVNEQRALQLVIERFVNITRLVNDLNTYDGTLIEYYKNNEVPFAGAGKVDLELADEDAIRSSLAKRIYKVRNSLVHAKEGEIPKYAPFAHDAELSQEIPLMRFTAEQVIISHGKVL
ncbi:hypothetical protein [Streptomyces sp. GMR22]|uniref:hypothetical protein n=1 Tax=Streptomyces sp. GMR22 TaxID=2759524 RepID=UPI0015FC965C|nr:hypothetical protein [Streptomyces sp. GMR22]MBA6433869.1 hypothetical protein [Streptomyces sp. GMR22]